MYFVSHKSYKLGHHFSLLMYVASEYSEKRLMNEECKSLLDLI